MVKEDFEVNHFSSKEDFLNGSLILIDKEIGYTSFAVVKKLRWLVKKHLKIRKLKVGHAGTLDPKATGLLVLCTGKMTKQIQYLLQDDKTYTGTIRLGSTTPSYDLETAPENHKDVSHLNLEMIKEGIQSFIGEIQQRPPLFSAKKVDGKRAYELAREGVEMELKKNNVTVRTFDVIECVLPDLKFKISCSKGTYIRSLAHDLGQNLSVGGHLVELRRTQSGKFHIENSMSLDQFEDKLRKIDV